MSRERREEWGAAATRDRKNNRNLSVALLHWGVIILLFSSNRGGQLIAESSGLPKGGDFSIVWCPFSQVWQHSCGINLQSKFIFLGLILTVRRTWAVSQRSVFLAGLYLKEMLLLSKRGCCFLPSLVREPLILTDRSNWRWWAHAKGLSQTYPSWHQLPQVKVSHAAISVLFFYSSHETGCDTGRIAAWISCLCQCRCRSVGGVCQMTKMESSTLICCCHAPLFTHMNLMCCKDQKLKQETSTQERLWNQSVSHRQF